MSGGGSRSDWFTEEDATCFASFWCTMMVLRGPPLYLHDERKRSEGARSLYGSGSLGPALTLGLWASLAAIVFPGQPLLLALATGSTAVHQFNNVQSGVAQSYLIVFLANIVLTAAAVASAVRGAGMAAAVNAAAPSIIDSYALVMLFTAFGKLNPRFFDEKVSAATAHVMGSVENLVTGFPFAIRVLRSLVDWAGPTAMSHFFFVACVAGAVVESLVGVLMFVGARWAQASFMYSMHFMFALTAFDFSTVAAALFPLWGIGNPGGIATWLGWVASPLARSLLPALLLMVLYNPGTPTEKLHPFRMCSLAFYVASCPLVYLGAHPPGAFLVGCGGDAQAEAWASTRAELGLWGERAVFVTACAALGVSVLNGLGPFIGLQTTGTYGALYSNLIVERYLDEDSNHILSPLFRRLGLPISAIQDLVTVIDTDVPQIARTLVLAPIAPPDVFSNLVKTPGWERAGKCHWSAPVSPYIYTSVPGRKEPIGDKEMVQRLPYVIPYFGFRCMVSTIPAMQDFFVVYEHKGERQRVERRKGQTISNDPMLLVTPNVYQRKVMKYRPLPPDLVY